MIGKSNYSVVAFVTCLVFSLSAAAQQPLPDPLGLDQALQLIDESHPELLQVKLQGQYAETDLLAVNARNNLRVDMGGRFRWTESNVDLPITEDSKDHQISLVVSKPIYDGGLTEASRQAAEFSGMSAEHDYSFARGRYAITVMQRFFDVILADLEAAKHNEAMATAFVRMDRGEDNSELGRLSDVDLLQLQSEFQESRVRLYNSEGKARESRQLLALALNRPDQIPSQITAPVLSVNERQLPEFDELLKTVMAGNPRLVALNHAIDAARSKVEAAKSGSKPKVTALLERAEQSRVTSTDDKWRIGVEWSMPLYDGGVTDAAVRRANLDLNKQIFERRQYELELRSQVRQLVEQFRILNATYDSNQAFTDYRELYMDRSRALYDLEVKTDLGDAMIEISESHLRNARQQFEMALVLAQLNLLAGEPVTNWTALTNEKPKPEGSGS